MTEETKVYSIRDYLLHIIVANHSMIKCSFSILPLSCFTGLKSETTVHQRDCVCGDKIKLFEKVTQSHRRIIKLW